MKQESQEDRLGLMEQKLQEKQKPAETKTPTLSQYQQEEPKLEKKKIQQEEPKLDKKRIFEDIFQGFQNKIEQKPMMFQKKETLETIKVQSNERQFL